MPLTPPSRNPSCAFGSTRKRHYMRIWLFKCRNVNKSATEQQLVIGDVPPTTIETKQMTTLEVTEVVLTESMSNTLCKVDPYPSKTPAQFLSREYLILDAAMSNLTQLILRPFEVLLTKDVINRYISTFRYFRASVKLRFLMVSTPMQYGLLAISTLPYCQSDTLWLTDTQQSQADMGLIDVCEQEAFEIELPYVSPFLFYDLKAPTKPKMWRVVMKMLSLNTITTSAPTSVSMKVFANFEKIETAGYLPAASFQSGWAGNPAARAGGRFQTLWRTARAAYSAMNAGNIATGATGALGGAATEKLMGMMTGEQGPPPLDKKIMTKIIPEEPSENNQVGLQLCSNLSTPVVKPFSGVRLGDDTCRGTKLMPTLRNVYDFKSMCSIPTYVGPFAFSTTGDVNVIPMQTIIAKSYSEYLMSMFKFFRGGSKIFIKFCASPLISGRLRITLYPTGIADSASNLDIGDLPTWVISVKGSFEWSLGVPYMQKYSWSLPTTFVPPVLRITLLDSLSQPFDKTVTVVAHVFLCSGDDIEFSGLESFIAHNAIPPPAEFQSSVHASMLETRMIGHTSSHGYQGGVTDIYQVLGRYSTRAPDVSDFRNPVPVLIEDVLVLPELDNFDYLCNLYLFYTGDTHVKMLFSSGPASGVLQLAVGNSKGVGFTTDFNSGNSIAVSHQAVWPLLEFTYPYMNPKDYESIYATPTFIQNNLFPFVVDETATVSKYWIAASPTFELGFLLPLPDWFVVDAEFQSVTVGPLSFMSQRVVDNTTPFPVFEMDMFGVDGDYLIVADVFCDVRRTAGTHDNSFFLSLQRRGDTDLLNSLGIGIVSWVDQANSGVYCGSLHFSAAVNVTIETIRGLDLLMGPVDGIPPVTDSYLFSLSAHFSPYNFSVIPTSITSQVGFVDVNNFPSVVDVNLVAQTVTPTVEIQASVPIEVFYGGGSLPLPIISSSPLEVEFVTPQVVQIDPSTLPLSVSATLDPLTSINVQGRLDPEFPVWTTTYR